MFRQNLLSACAALSLIVVPLAAQAAAHNVSPWLARATLAGGVEDSRPVRITVFLNLRDVAGLQALIKSQSTPHSAGYGKYLTPEQFHAAYAPPAADVARVQRTLAAYGFTLGHTPESGLFVEAFGTAGLVKSTFGVTQNLYAYHGRMLRANAEEPRIPAAIADIVKYVGGLDDTSLLRHASIRRLDDVAPAALSPAPNAPPPTAGSIVSPFCSTYWADHTAALSSPPALYPSTLPWLLCGYEPAQIRQAYGEDRVTEDGTGVRVGIVDLYDSPTILNDANRYGTKYGLPKLTDANFTQIVPADIRQVPANDPCGPQGWYGEQTLDVESVHGTAPGASIVYAGESCTDSGNSGLYNLIDRHLVDIVTNSYSYGGEDVSADFIASENQYFMQAAAEGISVLFSSGDGGDLAAGNGIASGTWEATSPYVTAVGGTSLALLGKDGAKMEWGWGNYRNFLNAATVSPDGTTIATSGLALPLSFYAGEGGGPSLSQLAPDYQVNVPYSLSGYTTLADGTLVPLETPHRVTPDISMVADPYTGYTVGETYTISGNAIYDAPCSPISATEEYCLTTIGGTSLASPMFAGVLALVNQSRFDAGKSAVGFVNPALYTMTVGPAGTTKSPITDVKPPKTPTALLRGYLGNPTEVRVVTMNSTITNSGKTVLEGRNTSLRTTKGYDEGSGLGTPNVPALISAFDAE